MPGPVPGEADRSSAGAAARYVARAEGDLFVAALASEITAGILRESATADQVAVPAQLEQPGRDLGERRLAAAVRPVSATISPRRS